MRIFSGFFGLIILGFAVAFALSNRQDVTIALWPLHNATQAPLYMIGLLPFLAGLICGSLLGVVSIFSHRMRARKLGKELDALNGRLKKMSGPEGGGKKSFWG